MEHTTPANGLEPDTCHLPFAQRIPSRTQFFDKTNTHNSLLVYVASSSGLPLCCPDMARENLYNMQKSRVFLAGLQNKCYESLRAALKPAQWRWPRHHLSRSYFDFGLCFFSEWYTSTAGFKVACKHSQHLRSAGKTFGSCMLLKPSRAIPTQQCTSQIQEWTDMHKAIQLRREQTE